ncbi:MAG: hypothetical protein OXQ31_16430 [Spirochaetaceae bacterium]|nr:hypothetical protein [Spirochaetaceae bacterium]
MDGDPNRRAAQGIGDPEVGVVLVPRHTDAVAGILKEHLVQVRHERVADFSEHRVRPDDQIRDDRRHPRAVRSDIQ